MKLCFFYTDISMNGGIERVLSILSTEFADHWNYDVTIVSLYKSSDNLPYEFSNNVKIIYLNNCPYEGTPGSFVRLFQQIKSLKKIKNYFSFNIYDVIAAQSFPSAFMLYLARVRNQPVIAVEHVYYDYYNRYIKKLREFVYRSFIGVVVLTNNDKKSFDKYITNCQVIPNPITSSSEYPASLDSKKIISVGRLEKQKGFDNLIKVFKAIYNKNPDWSLHIFGKGSLKDDLQSQINQLDLQEAIILEGVTKDIKEEYRKAAFCVISSRFEGFSMTITEAMKEGVPCISFRCPNGPEDLIENGEDGILVENQDLRELESSIQKLISNYSLRRRLGDKAFISIKRLDIHIIAKKWDEYFEKCIVKFNNNSHSN